MDVPTSCAACSACCEEQGLPPGYLDPSLLTVLPDRLREEIARHQREEEETGRTRHERGLPCIWLDTERRRCREYEHRPDRCRDVPVAGASCLFWRARRPPAPMTPARRRRRRKKSAGDARA